MDENKKKACYKWIISQILLTVLALSIAILPITGVSTTGWLTATNCTELNNIPLCCNASNPDSYDDDCGGSLSLTKLGSDLCQYQALSLVILIWSFIVFFSGWAFSDRDNCIFCCRCCTCRCICGFLFTVGYLVAGVFSLFGCGEVSKKYPGQEQGNSFRLCFAAGCLACAEVLFFIIFNWSQGCASKSKCCGAATV